jgi:PAS domain S-box-containing protein
MRDAVVVVGPAGKITTANRATYLLLDYEHEAEELVGLPIRDIFIEGESPSSSQLEQAWLGVDLRDEAAEMRSKDGKAIPISLNGSAVVGPDGDLAGVVLVARDERETTRLIDAARSELHRRRLAEEALVAEKRRVEDELNKTRRQLVKAERLATVGSLAGGLGHELKVIALVLQVQIEGLAPLADSGALDRQVFDEVTRASQLIADHAERLLALARPGPDHTLPVDLREVFSSVISMLRIAGKLQGIRIDTDLPEQPVLVTVNRMRIEQILVNLVTNAADALAPVQDRPKVITLGVERIPGTQRVACRVEDNGCGIPQEHIDRVFDSYFSTKSPEDRTGLGLSVARQLVEAYGGTLLAQSRVGQGTSFTFDLLRVHEEGEED